MKTIFISLFAFLLVQLSTAQSAADYLCTNPNKSLIFKDFRKKEESHQYVGNFDYKGVNKVYMYQRSWITDKLEAKKDTLIMIVHNNTLIIPGYVYKGTINNDDPYADTIPMVKAGEKVIKNTRVSADMSTMDFEVSITYLANYTSQYGLKFTNVICFDKYNRELDYHYTIYVAQGEGMVDQGINGLNRIK